MFPPSQIKVPAQLAPIMLPPAQHIPEKQELFSIRRVLTIDLIWPQIKRFVPNINRKIIPHPDVPILVPIVTSNQSEFG